MPQYTKEFSQFIAKMDFSCLNSTDIAAVCSCLKDFVAVTIAGSSGREAESNIIVLWITPCPLQTFSLRDFKEQAFWRLLQ